jgi:ABC-type antimicrobial peptide transport system permease subunit
MTLEAESLSAVGSPLPEAGWLQFWSWRAALAIELAIFGLGWLLDDLGHAISLTVAGLFLCAFLSFLTLQRSDSPLGVAARRLARKRVAMGALAFIAFFYLMGVLAPVLPIPAYTHQDLTQSLKAPSLSHPFGTDRIGRDLLSRCIWSSQTTVIVTAATLTAGGLVLGIGLGLLSGSIPPSCVSATCSPACRRFSCSS